jgi:hypothetical protein
MCVKFSDAQVVKQFGSQIKLVCVFISGSHHVCLLHFSTCLGLARTIYIRCIYGIFGREMTKYTVIYGVYIRFWPTLCMFKQQQPSCLMLATVAPYYYTQPS